MRARLRAPPIRASRDGARSRERFGVDRGVVRRLSLSKPTAVRPLPLGGGVFAAQPGIGDHLTAASGSSALTTRPLPLVSPLPTMVISHERPFVAGVARAKRKPLDCHHSNWRSWRWFASVTPPRPSTVVATPCVPRPPFSPALPSPAQPSSRVPRASVAVGPAGTVVCDFAAFQAFAHRFRSARSKANAHCAAAVRSRASILPGVDSLSLFRPGRHNGRRFVGVVLES